MLKQLAREKHGFQTLNENGDIIYTGNLSDKEYEVFEKRWTVFSKYFWCLWD